MGVTNDKKSVTWLGSSLEQCTIQLGKHYIQSVDKSKKEVHIRQGLEMLCGPTHVTVFAPVLKKTHTRQGYVHSVDLHTATQCFRQC